MTVRQRKFRAGYNHFRSFTMVPLNLLRDCHFCASVDEDSTEIQFYLLFQLVGISELVLLFLQIPSFPFPLCPSPLPLIPLHLTFPAIFHSVFALLLFANCTSLPLREEKASQCIKRKGLTRLSIKLNLFFCKFL